MTSIITDGYTDLPPGHVAAIVHFLEMRARPARLDGPATGNMALSRLEFPDLEEYRRLYRRIGTDLLWNARLRLDDAQLRAILADPAVEVYLPQREGRAVGLVELDFRESGEAELAYFGLVPEFIRRGIGRWLMNRALELAWRDGVERVTLHTCTLDHPDALSFYMRSGFVPYGRKLELFPDPRHEGLLPREAAPQVPLIDG